MAIVPEEVTGEPDATSPLGIVSPTLVTVPLFVVAPGAIPASLVDSAVVKAWIPLA
jgi:hypothetical protein